MIKKIKDLSKEEVEELQGNLEMKYSIENLIKLLNENDNDFEKLNSKLYSKLIEDNLECMKKINNFWNKQKQENKIILKNDEELFVDFARCILGIRKVENCNRVY